MLRHRLVCIAVLCLLVSLAAAHVNASAMQPATPILLYDGAQGTLPAAQGWAFLVSKGQPGQSLDAGAALLDTSAAQTISAGYFASQAGFAGSTTPVPLLDHTAGFTLTFTLQVLEEQHANPNRAGFSVIVLGSDARGIELGFWQNRVWAQEGGSDALFTQAEGASYSTGAALTRYDLTFRSNTYELRANGSRLLGGPARDYSAFAGTPDPYSTPNFLFLGDDTGSAAARFRLGMVAVALAEPASEPPKHALFVPVAQR